MHQETRESLENSLIGWMLYEPESVLGVEGLTPDVFTDAFSQAVAGAIIERVERGEVANALTVADALADLVEIEGGAKRYTMHCLAMAHLCSSPREHVNTLRQERQRLRLISLCNDVIAKSEAPNQNAKTLSEHMLEGLEGIMRDHCGIHMRSSKQVTESVLESLKEIPPCFSTGLSRLDQAMDGGLYAGKSYGIAARKKVGKTIIASTISCNLDLAGVPHLFVCGEMSDEEVHQRTLARLARVYPSTFRNRDKATPEALTRIAQASFQLTGAARFLNAPGLTFGELKRAASIALSRYGIKGLILDYWQLVGGKEKGRSTAEHLDEVAQWLADFGRKNRIWTLTMAQINQDGNTRGGEGMRLAFDQVYHLQPCLNASGNADISNPGRWLEMLDTRYTPWHNVGEACSPRLFINDFGPFFEEGE